MADTLTGKPVSTLISKRFSTTEEERLKITDRNFKLSPDVITGREALVVSAYSPTDDEVAVRQMIIKHFTEGDANLRKPRREFNDLALSTRCDIDRMAWLNYQPNDGDPLAGDEANAWKSNASRPIVRNKIISIAAHATARLVFPKVFAWDEDSEEQRDAAQVMEDLMEWSGNQSDYPMTSLKAVLQSLIEPACVVFTEYAETMRQVKDEQKEGEWTLKQILDKTLSGFIDAVIPCSELYIENFYEPDIQKQGWLIWRRVHSFSLMQAKYGHLPNFQYVRPGIQTIFDDANRLFYEVYDSNMRQEDCEEIIYWNRSLDLKIIMVNGVMLTASDNPNPRQDKLYPFAKFGYEMIAPNFFYYKGLSAKMLQDAKVINSLYQMVIDGTYLQLFPPLKNIGGEAITSDVLIPGAAITLSNPNADVSPIIPQMNNIGAGINALGQVEQSISETSMDQWMQGTSAGAGARRQSAFAMSIIQQNANTLLGLFIQMISQFVKDYGKLRMGDIIQYMTIGEVNSIESDAKLVFKTFILPNKQSSGKSVTRKIKFDASLPDTDISDEKADDLSRETYDQQGGGDSKTLLYRVNPPLFRSLSFMIAENPDTLDPMSNELEKQYGLEEYDRMVANPQTFDPEQTGRLLLNLYKDTKKDPDKFISKQLMEQSTATSPMEQIQQAMMQKGQIKQPGAAQPIQTPGQPTPAQVASH